MVITGLTRKFSKKCQFCPPKIQCFCGLPQFEKPNILQFFPSVLSKSFGNDFRIDIWRVVRVVEGAALEMLCPERDLGFESLTLRHRRHKLCIACDDFFIKNHPSLTPLFLLSPKSLPTFRGPHETVTMRVCWTFLFCLLREATPKLWKEQAVFWRERGGFLAFFLYSNPSISPPCCCPQFRPICCRNRPFPAGAFRSPSPALRTALNCNQGGRRYSPW